MVTGRSAGGIFTKLPVLDEEMAQKLTERLSERAGGEIDIEDVLDSETIEDLSSYVRDQLEGGAVDGFVRYLRTVDGSTRPPLLLFHPAGGSSMAYEALLKRLPEDVPVIGFDRVEGSIAERVEQYLPKLREVVPHGPYLLAGWSLGGALAYGCAQGLRAAGEDVALVALLDAVRPNGSPEESQDEKRARLDRYMAFAKRTYGVDDVPVPMDRLVEADDEGQFRIIMELLSMSNAKIPGGIIEHQRTSFLDNRALSTIEPTPYGGKVVLYRADKMQDGAIELEPRWADIPPDGRWGEVVSDLEIVHIGGDHLAMIDEPYIGRVGADLARRLSDLSSARHHGAGVSKK